MKKFLFVLLLFIITGLISGVEIPSTTAAIAFAFACLFSVIIADNL